MRISLAAPVLALHLGLVSAPRASDKIELPIRAENQKTEVWCWAAVGQSVVNYLNAASYRQCDIASSYLGLDCCQGASFFSSPTAACERKGWANEAAARFGVLSKRTDPVTTAQVRIATETALRAGRPVTFTGADTSGYLHVVLVYGMSIRGDSAKYLIDDPYWGRYRIDTDRVFEFGAIGQNMRLTRVEEYFRR